MGSGQVVSVGAFECRNHLLFIVRQTPEIPCKVLLKFFGLRIWCLGL